MTSFDNLPNMFFAQAHRYGERRRYRYKRGGRWHEIGWASCAERVRAMALGLMSLGLEPGERVALLAATRAEWMEFDLAVLASGGVTVPIYPSDLVNECGYIIWNSGAAIVCVENARQLAKIREAQQQGFLLDGRACQIAVRQIVSLEDTGDGSVVSVQQLMERGRSVAAAVLQQRIGRIGRDQPTTKAGLRLPAERSEWAADPRVGKLSGAEVAEVNRRLASYESIKYHRILPRDFSPEGGELTPSLKVKRKVIVERYRDLIEGMY